MLEMIKTHLLRVPFVPFRIEKTGGVWYEVHNPAMVSVTRHAIELAYPIENGKQRFIALSLIHVLSVEILLPTPSEPE